MTDANELRALEPCPFCGEDDAVVAPTNEEGYEGPVFWGVGCGCTAYVGPWGNEKEAVTAWNTRALIASREAAVKPLRNEWRTNLNRAIRESDGAKGHIDAQGVFQPLGDDAGLVNKMLNGINRRTDGTIPKNGTAMLCADTVLQAVARFETLTRELDKAREAMRTAVTRIIEMPVGDRAATRLVNRKEVLGIVEAAALSATTALGGTKSRAATRIETFTRELAALPCDTKSVDDMEVGCCAPCRARAALAQDTTPVDAKKKG